MPRKSRLLWAIVLLFIIVVVVQGVDLIRRGFSARDTPSALETYMARSTRKLAVPASARDQKNPFTETAEILGEARVSLPKTRSWKKMGKVGSRGERITGVLGP